MDKLKLRKLLEGGASIHNIALRVAYYARISTDSDSQLNSLSNQTGYYTDYIKEHKSWTFAGGYVDEGISGTSVTKRVNFLRMIEDARCGKFDYIVTKEISRFSRNTLDSIKYTRALLSYGVGVYFQNDNIDTMTPDAELRLTIMASIAQDEVRKLSERVRFGFKRAQENGIVLGCDNVYGYEKSKGLLAVNEAEAETVRRIFAMYTEGRLGLRRIANELAEQKIYAPSGGVFTYGTLAGIIRNPKYKGYYAGKKYTTADYRDNKKIRLEQSEWILHKDENIPQIVDEQLWEKANELLDARGSISREHADASQNRYPYSGKLVCAEHGTSFHRHINKNKSGERECWNCRIYRLHGKEACNLPTIYSYELDEILSGIYSQISIDREKIIQRMSDFYTADNAADNIVEKLKSAENERAIIIRKKDKLFELYTDDMLEKSEFKERNDLLSAALSDVDSGIDNLKSQIGLQRRRVNTAEVFRNAVNQYLSGNIILEAANQALLEKITVGQDSGESVTLDILLKTGEHIPRKLSRENHSISAWNTGISQAQVSRLEKGALERIRKQL